MGFVRFDGTAVTLLNARGMSAVRAQGGKTSWEPTPEDVDQLYRIRQADHKSVPRHLYHTCARIHRAHATATMATVHQLEATKPLSSATQKTISTLRELYKKQLAHASEAKQLGYARRSPLHHWFACKISKDRRPHFFLTLTLVGFGINFLWLVYLVALAIHRHNAKDQHSRGM